MIRMYLIFAIVLVSCRFFAGYDSRYQNGKYIVVNNPKLRMLLIDEMSFFEGKRLKKDINKMTFLGLIFYVYSLVTLVLSILLHIIVPPIPIEPWETETDKCFMYVDTLNEELAAICIWLLLLSTFACIVFLMFQYIKTTKQKWIKILTYITCTIMLAMVVFILFGIIEELFMCLI